MKHTLQVAKRVLVAAVYVFLIGIGGSLLAPNPSSAFILIPIFCGTALAYHAVNVDRLDELGYATMGFYGFLFLSALVVGGMRALGLLHAPLPALWVQIVGTIGLSVVLLAVYLVAANDDRGATSPTTGR